MSDESRLSELETTGEFDSTRQRDMFNPLDHQGASCTLVGCGGIGSPLAIGLSKLGIPKLTLIDPDHVESHNVPNQFYTITDGKEERNKVTALKELCAQFGASDIKAVCERVDKCADDLHGLVITGLDSMEARKEVWDMVKMQTRVERLIDARIGKFDIAIYVINPCDMDDIKYYEENCLYSDEEAVELACTERAIIDVSFQCAAQLVRMVRKHFNGEDVERTIAFNQDNLGVSKF